MACLDLLLHASLYVYPYIYTSFRGGGGIYCTYILRTPSSDLPNTSSERMLRIYRPRKRLNNLRLNISISTRPVS